jgi:pimeloyl-ACP methyl ester carboxylesterase
MKQIWLCVIILFTLTTLTHAQGSGATPPDKETPVPPKGIDVPEELQRELKAGVDELGKEIEKLRQDLKGKAELLELLPDVQIYHNAVRYALEYNEFFNPGEFAVARTHLKQGMERAQQLRDGKPAWTSATGAVARGYISKIDGSIQPYGLVVPVSWRPNSTDRFRLDTWFHGRGEKLTELSFINDRQKSLGEFAPPQAFVLHLYGRYCNANKFAGEIDLFEALENVRKHYPIDDNRIVVRGFSMGGAACWQFATHYAGQWAAAAPGAGFSETADFLKVFQKETLKPTWYEQKLWHLYDCTDYAINLFNCPVVAYSGEKDIQKQAADMMVEAMKKEGLELTHIIGPNTGHGYHPQAKEEINRRIDEIVARGRNPLPAEVKFTTWTLRYNEMLWVTVDALGEHWERARVNAAIVDGSNIKITTSNVTAFTLWMPGKTCPLDNSKEPTLLIDGDKVNAPKPQPDRVWLVHLHKDDKGHWAAGVLDDGLRKQHGLQGPIDDAFMDSFLMVRPTGKPLNEKAGKWTNGEMAHAMDHWRRQFRGEARVKNDDAITEQDIADHNLVLWGDPSSNKVLAKIADKLPIRWTADNVVVGEKSYASTQHVPVLIYPNPLNPKRYVVLNSGFTFREYDYLNNARQVPKLPDWAVVDIDEPATSRSPGGIVNAGFFDEKWRVK